MIYIYPFFGDLYQAKLRKVQLDCTCIALDIYNKQTEEFEEFTLLTENRSCDKSDHVFFSKTMDKETDQFIKELISSGKIKKDASGALDEYVLSKEFIEELEGKTSSNVVKERRKSYERATVHDKGCRRFIKLDDNPRHWQ